MTTRLAIVLGSILFAAGGCARNPNVVTEERLQIVERQREPQRLVAYAKGFIRIGDYTRAEQYLNAALENGGSESEIVPLLLSICVKDRRYRSAVEYAENYLRRHPREHRLRFVVATLYVGLGDNDRARKQLERVIEQNPKHAEAHYALAVLFRDQLMSFAKADEHFRHYLQLDPRGEHAEEATGSLLRSVP
jgi:tetratricopeptide (TPR) repeat protein